MPAPDPLDIAHETEDHRGRFVARRGPEVLGKMTYSRGSATLIIIDHTEVTPAARGDGVARQLLDTLVAWARETGTTVLSTCPYTTAEFAGDPGIRDVL